MTTYMCSGCFKCSDSGAECCKDYPLQIIHEPITSTDATNHNDDSFLEPLFELVLNRSELPKQEIKILGPERDRLKKLLTLNGWQVAKKEQEREWWTNKVTSQLAIYFGVELEDTQNIYTHSIYTTCVMNTKLLKGHSNVD